MAFSKYCAYIACVVAGMAFLGACSHKALVEVGRKGPDALVSVTTEQKGSDSCAAKATMEKADLMAKADRLPNRGGRVYLLTHSKFNKEKPDNCVAFTQDDIDRDRIEVYSMDLINIPPKFVSSGTAIMLELKSEVLQAHGTFVKQEAEPGFCSHVRLYGELKIPLAAVARVFIFRNNDWELVEETMVQETQLIPNAIYKIVPRSDFDVHSSGDCITLSQLDLDSHFIHASYGRQVMGTAKKFFKGAKEILAIELLPEILTALGFVVKEEANKPGGDRYVHLYEGEKYSVGPSSGRQRIDLHAVARIVVLKEQPDGSWKAFDW